MRSGPLRVSLEVFASSTKIDHVFIDELKRYYLSQYDIYGITRNLETMSYALVFKNTEYGYCPRCKKANQSDAWCNSCDPKALVDGFRAWSTGNEDLDLFIQETQRNATSYSYYEGYLEYLPYDRFIDVKSLAQGGFAKVFTATWSDGYRMKIKKDGIENNWVKGRSEPFTVALKIFNNSAKMEQSFVSELKLGYQIYQKVDLNAVPYYGITKDPETMNSALVLQYFPDGDLRRILSNPNNELTWVKNKLRQLSDILNNLQNIHDQGYIHRNIHSGNILVDVDDNRAYLTDFGLSQPASSPCSPKIGTYGVVPYMAPELLRGELHSQASDIYAIGVIMSEIASNEPAFYDRDHDKHLQSEIISGLRPEVPSETTPKCYRDLMERCLSGDPFNRPTAKELYELFYEWCDDNNDTAEVKQFKTADEQWKPKKQRNKHPGAVYTSRFVSYVTEEEKEKEEEEEEDTGSSTKAQIKRKVDAAYSSTSVCESRKKHKTDELIESRGDSSSQV